MQRNKTTISAPEALLNAPVLHRALFKRDYQQLKKLLKQTPKLPTNELFLELTPLGLAVSLKDLKGIRILLDHGADYTTYGREEKSQPPFFEALGSGNKEIIAEFARESVDVTTIIHKKHDALAKAASLGKIDLINTLIEKFHFNIDSCQSTYSPVVMAIGHNQLHVLRYLIKRKANIKYGVYFATLYENKEAIKILLDEGKADIEEIYNDKTPLLNAVFHNKYEIAKYLLERGANIEAKACIYTPLWMAAKIHGDIKMIEMLVEKGANTKAICEGVRAIIAAIEGKFYAAVVYLLEHGAANDLDDQNPALLFTAAYGGDLDIFKFIARITPNYERLLFATTPEGFTAINRAAYMGNIDIIRYIINPRYIKTVTHNIHICSMIYMKLLVLGYSLDQIQHLNDAMFFDSRTSTKDSNQFKANVCRLLARTSEPPLTNQHKSIYFYDVLSLMYNINISLNGSDYRKFFADLEQNPLYLILLEAYSETNKNCRIDALANYDVKSNVAFLVFSLLQIANVQMINDAISTFIKQIVVDITAIREKSTAIELHAIADNIIQLTTMLHYMLEPPVLVMEELQDTHQKTKFILSLLQKRAISLHLEIDEKCEALNREHEAKLQQAKKIEIEKRNEQIKYEQAEAKKKEDEKLAREKMVAEEQRRKQNEIDKQRQAEIKQREEVERAQQQELANAAKAAKLLQQKEKREAKKLKKAIKKCLPHAMPAFAIINKLPGNHYLVGGCVLDILNRKNDSGDFDFISSCDTDEMIKQCGFRKSAYHANLYTYRDHKAKQFIDLKTRPDITHSLVQDATERDYTICALYLDCDGNLHDPTEKGIADYQNKVLRMIGDPATRFAEDPARLIRAVKYIIKGYKPCEELEAALHDWNNDEVVGKHKGHILNLVNEAIKKRRWLYKRIRTNHDAI